jgi:hypothetical protein
VLALGNPILELLFEDFQEQVFEELEVFFSGQQTQVSLINFAPIIFLSIL